MPLLKSLTPPQQNHLKLPALLLLPNMYGIHAAFLVAVSVKRWRNGSVKYQHAPIDLKRIRDGEQAFSPLTKIR